MSDLSCGQILGVILAGGLARRMGGGDKGLLVYDGATLLDHLIARTRPQVSGLVLNANGDPARFEHFGLPIVPDDLPNHPGPLAGVLAGLDWAAAHRPDIAAIVTVPCDGPFIPATLVADFLAATGGCATPLAVASSRGRTNPVTALWPVALRDDLRRAVVDDGLRKVNHWTARHGVVEVAFPDQQVKGQARDPFFNANTPEDLAQMAETLRPFTTAPDRHGG